MGCCASAGRHRKLPPGGRRLHSGATLDVCRDLCRRSSFRPRAHSALQVAQWLSFQRGKPPSGQPNLRATATSASLRASPMFIFSLEGGCFLACDAPSEAMRLSSGRHCPLISTATTCWFSPRLAQRFALMGLSEQVAREWLPPQGGEETADLDLRRDRKYSTDRDSLLAFTARGSLFK